MIIRSLGTTPISGKKCSRSEKAILGDLGAFQVILGAALGVQETLLGMRNPILGMASPGLCNAKTTILGALPESFSEFMGTHMKDFHWPPVPASEINCSRIICGL